jgi:flavodoxin
MTKGRLLVVFYSRTGTTKKVAEAIAAKLGCDIEEIIDTKSRRGLLGFLRSGLEATLKRLTTIEEIKNDPALYDVVIIGTPVWNGTMSSAIRTYLSQYKEDLQNIAFFCTQGSSGNNAFEEMESLCGKKPLALLELTSKEVEKGEGTDKVEQFVTEISK